MKLFLKCLRDGACLDSSGVKLCTPLLRVFLFFIYYLFIYFLEAIMDGCYEYDQATSFMEPSNEHDFHLPD